MCRSYRLLLVLVRAVAKELRTAGPEVGESGDVLLGRQSCCLVEVDFFLFHCFSPLVRRRIPHETLWFGTLVPKPRPILLGSGNHFLNAFGLDPDAPQSLP